MKKLFAIILFITFIFTTTPVMAKHHTPHRYANRAGRPVKVAGAVPRYNNVYATQYRTAMCPNYNTGTHAKYEIATAPNYRNHMSVNYRTQMSPTYHSHPPKYYNY